MSKADASNRSARFLLPSRGDAALLYCRRHNQSAADAGNRLADSHQRHMRRKGQSTVHDIQFCTANHGIDKNRRDRCRHRQVAKTHVPPRVGQCRRQRPRGR